MLTSTELSEEYKEALFILSADARPTTTLESINLYGEFLSKKPLQHQSSLSSGRDASNVVRRANWQSGKVGRKAVVSSQMFDELETNIFHEDIVALRWSDFNV